MKLMQNPELWIGKRIPSNLSFDHLPYDICDECGGFYPDEELAGFLYPESEEDFALLDELGIDEALTFCQGCRDGFEAAAADARRAGAGAANTGRAGGPAHGKGELSMKVESIFDLEIGDRVRHGRNYGTVWNKTESGPEIEWDHGLIDYQYTEDMHKAHPLHKIPRHLNRGDEEIREAAWNLCKQYDGSQIRRNKILLTNFVSTELEKRFGEETENLFRSDWQEEVRLFCETYGYE